MIRPRPARRRRASVPPSIETLEDRRLLSLPPGFTQATFASGLNSPTGMAFAPDGRLFVIEQGGGVRVVTPSGQLLSQPFASVPARFNGEQGLIGLAFDPNFASNGHLYLHWITGSSLNRVSRLTADPSNPNVAAAGSQMDILTLPSDPNYGYNHQGGALAF